MFNNRGLKKLQGMCIIEYHEVIYGYRRYYKLQLKGGKLQFKYIIQLLKNTNIQENERIHNKMLTMIILIELWGGNVRPRKGHVMTLNKEN